MPQPIKADGDTWRARLSECPPRPETQAVVFFCVTTSQRPYRVVEVPADRLKNAEELEALRDSELRELFEASRSLDYPQMYLR